MSIIKSYGSGDATGSFYTKTLTDSLRFNEGPNANTTDSSYLTRAAVTPTSAYKWTLSVWIKRSVLHAEGSSAGIISSSVNGEDLFFSFDDIKYQHYSNSATRISIITNNSFRDTSNWYHVVCAVDHSNSTTDDKAIIYVNGVRQTLSTNTIASGTYNSTLLTATNTIQIGKDRAGSHFTGYMAEMHFVDGQQLTPTTFGETKQGIWIPKTISNLTYGNNGFYLNFGNSSAIGEDSAGSNDYTAYNLNDYDIVPDTPTNNFCTLNPNFRAVTANTLSEGNLKCVTSTSGRSFNAGSFLMTPNSGKWYWEFRPDANSGGMGVAKVNGILGANQSATSTSTSAGTTDYYYGETNWVMYGDGIVHNGTYVGGTGSGMGSPSYPQIWGIGIDMDASPPTISYYIDGSSVGSADLDAGYDYIPIVGDGSGGVSRTININFGQNPTFNGTETAGTNTDGNGKGLFHDAVPSNHLALCSSNLPDVTLSANEDEQPNDHFETNIYTGVGGSATLTSFNFKPDFTWIKNITDSGTNHVLVDSSRGSSKELQLPSTGAETSNGWISAFTTNGFTHSAQGNATQNVVFDAYSSGSGSSQKWYPKVPAGISIQIGSTTYNAGDNISASDTTTLLGAYGVNSRNVAWTSSGDISYYGWSSGNQNVNPSATNVSPYIFASYRYQASQPNCRSVGARFRSDGGIEFIHWYENYNQIYDDPPLYQCSGNVDSFQGVITGTITSINVANVTVTAGASTYDPVNKNGSKYATWNWKGSSDTPTKTYTVKVHNFSGNNRYIFDDFQTAHETLNLQRGGVYTFNMDDSSNASHPFSIGTAANGTVYTSGITYSLDGVSKTYSEYTSGFASATTRRLVFTVPNDAPGLYYWCSAHSGMGGGINTNSTKGSSNFDGTIQSKVQSNPTAGFSIITYTGTNANGTIGHELGKVPSFYVVKSRSASATNWRVYHDKVSSDPETDYLNLDTSAVVNDLASNWNDTAPTTTTISLGTASDVNGNGATFLAYVFAEIAGYSKFGSYEGNNSSTDNAFVFTGFLPSFVAIKNIDAAEDWTIRDIEHSGYYTDRANPIPIGVQPSTSTNATGGSAFNIDFVSNGFKVRGNNADVGASNTYVYLAFASNPFKFSNAR